jgi:hypothetical protein
VPGATARFAYIGTGNPSKPVLRRVEQHALEEDPVGCLDLGTLGDRDPGRSQAFRQLVPDAFELAETEQSRLAAVVWWLLEPAHPVCGHERLRQLPFEALDLDPQGATRCALIYFGNGRLWSGNTLLYELHDSLLW